MAMSGNAMHTRHASVNCRLSSGFHAAARRAWTVVSSFTDASSAARMHATTLGRMLSAASCLRDEREKKNT